ncbi:hypothetical protein ACPC54_29470 [Kitasatospora sp. NPDC094028]
MSGTAVVLPPAGGTPNVGRPNATPAADRAADRVDDRVDDRRRAGPARP